VTIFFVIKITFFSCNTCTKAPMTPRLANLKYSNCGDLSFVLRKGYKYKGMPAANKKI